MYGVKGTVKKTHGVKYHGMKYITVCKSRPKIIHGVEYSRRGVCSQRVTFKKNISSVSQFMFAGLKKSRGFFLTWM